MGPDMEKDKPGKKNVEEEKHLEPGSDKIEEENCRCKEVSRKTPMGLIRLMLRDLAFWKKPKKKKQK